MWDWKRRRAVFFNDRGDYIGHRYFNRFDKIFMFKNRAFNVDLLTTYSRRANPVWTTFEYYYNINNPDPIVLSKMPEPKFNSKAYKSILKTKLIGDLNKAHRTGFLEGLLNPKMIIFLLILIAVVYYFASGGKIT